MAEGANQSLANSADVWKEDYIYRDVIDYFGIVDRNKKVKPITGKTLNCFSTNLFIKMELNKDDKVFLYLTGLVKLVELFEARTIELQTETDQWMLYIYCDSMFFEEGGFKNDVYEKERDRNNNNNRKIKGNYGENKDFFKRLLQLYREYLAIIIANKGSKYSFVKLFSYNCMDVKSENIKKGNPYLGHPSTFGSFIRFLPFFDDSISRVFTINISHAITPKLVYSIKEWIKSQKELITIDGTHNYSFIMKSNDPETIINNIIFDFYKKHKSVKNFTRTMNTINMRHAAGLIGCYRKKDAQIIVNINIFMNIIKKIIKEFINKKDKINFFIYGIDEMLLTYIIELVKKLENKNIFDSEILLHNHIYFFCKKEEEHRINLLYNLLKDNIENNIEDNTKFKHFIELINFNLKKLYDQRTLGRYLINLIKKNTELINFFADNESFDFNSLLNSFDEDKPLFIVENERQKVFNDFYTYYDFTMDGLIEKLINYYTNDKFVLKIPYVMKKTKELSIAQGKQAAAARKNNGTNTAGGGKNKKKTKKPKRKTNKTKKLIKNKS